MLMSLMKALAKPLPALASIAPIAGLYIAWLAVQEAQFARDDQRQQFFAEKSLRITAISGLNAAALTNPTDIEIRSGYGIHQ